ncbi:hypothetical protein DH2020_033622 [Rehmannia glutinosa]|uniref:Uncharacterized protein n=1 Tax=Rehmannia glutinosa TaxID=99300 RepID=A0ABR0VDL6_REHGL
MGIWEFMGSTAETVKRNAPDTTPLKNACKYSYTYGSAAFTQIDQAVRINGLYKVGQWMPDDETKSKIGIYTTKFAQNAGHYAIQEGYKLIPGGVAFSNILTKTLNDVKHENVKLEKLDVSGDRVGAPKKHYSGGRKFIDGPEMRGRGGVGAVSGDIGVGWERDKNPEDVIRVFMMKEFFGTRFFDDLVVHELARGKGKKPE